VPLSRRVSAPGTRLQSSQERPAGSSGMRFRAPSQCGFASDRSWALQDTEAFLNAIRFTHPQNQWPIPDRPIWYARLVAKDSAIQVSRTRNVRTLLKLTRQRRVGLPRGNCNGVHLADISMCSGGQASAVPRGAPGLQSACRGVHMICGRPG